LSPFPSSLASFASFPFAHVRSHEVAMDIRKMMAQAQEMQEKLQRQMADMKISATSGGGMVIVTVNGNKQLISLQLDPEVVSKDDVGMLQDLIIAAVNDAHRRVDEALAGHMQGIMGGMGMPGLG
jgi:DNA-binding YbaB/EbfC family protein